MGVYSSWFFSMWYSLVLGVATKFVCWLCATGIWLTLNNVQYTNNSVVTIRDIGTGSAALLCTTTNSDCCSSGNPTSQWYFPSGSQVPNLGLSPPSMTFFRTRSRSPGAVRLNRNSEATTTGVFRCDIPDGSGDLQSLYVGIYTATTGESCILKRNTTAYADVSWCNCGLAWVSSITYCD